MQRTSGKRTWTWPAAKSIGRWSWTIALVVVLGLLSIGMLLTTYRIGERHILHDLPIGKAIAEIRMSLVTSHLWLEEYLTGDPEVDPDSQILGELQRALSLCRALLEGGAIPYGQSLPMPLQDPVMRGQVGPLQVWASELLALTRHRLEERDTAGVGSELDRNYDELFRRILEHTTSLRHEVEVDMLHKQQRSRFLFTSILLAWTVLLTLAVTGLAQRERRQRRAELALRESEAQLRQSQKLDAVGRLAGGLAHDINNYLAAIAAQCELIKIVHKDDPKLLSNVSPIVETVARTSSLIQRLLSFSRKHPTQLEVTNLNEISERSRNLWTRLLGENIRIESLLTPKPWNVKVDPAQIEQILVNLLVNARDAMPQGGTIRIETANTELDREQIPQGAGAGPGEYVVLTVADTGIGIPPAIRDRIFEPFFTTKEASGRSGLGLSTVYGIVRQNRGFLRVEGEEGAGTSFQVYLPRSPEKVVSVRSPLPSAALEPGTVTFRILVVEDSEDFRKAIASVLQALGHEVTVAASGEDALDLFRWRRGALDLVISDVVMPGMTGRELVQQLWSSEPGLRVIFMSGYVNRIEVEELISDQAVEFLAKPFGAKALLAKIEELMSRSSGTSVAGGTG